MFDPHTSARADRGIASILLLFAMSAFAVLGIAALSTGLGSAASGKTFTIFQAIPEEAMLRFVAPLVVPNGWRSENAQGSYRFTLPVIVPETGGEESGATSAWHAMTEIPGMAVCCESRRGVCNDRYVPAGGARISDWTPGADDALRLAFELASRPDATAVDHKSETVTATVTTGAAPADGEIVACQLEWDGAVIAKGTAMLQLSARDDGGGAAASAQSISGRMMLSVKTK